MLRQAAESLWSATSPDDTMTDRPPGIFLWVEDAREPGCRMVPHRKRPPHSGPFFLREVIVMGEINVGGESRLSLQQALALNHADVLTVAFEQRLMAVGGVAAMLDSVSPTTPAIVVRWNKRQ